MPNNTLILGSLAASGSLYTQDSLLFGKFSDATNFEVDSFIDNTSGSLSFDFTNDRFSFNKPVSASVFYGDGSNLTGVSSDPFPYTGSVEISGSLTVIDGAIKPQATIEQKYFTDTNSQTIKFGSAYELFGTNHSSGGYIYYLNPVGWASGWHLAIGNSSAKHSFSNTAYTSPGQINTTNIKMGSNLFNYETSPHTGLKYNNQNGWTFVIRGGDNTNKLLIDSSGNATTSGSLTVNQGFTSEDITILKNNTTITGSNSLSGNYALKITNTSGDNILNVENDGNVGLGLADPSYKLQVRGATNDSTDYPFRVENSSGTPLFRVRSDGYVMFGNLGENLAIDFTGGNRYLKFFNSSISAQGSTGITATGTIGFDPGTGTSNKITFINAADAYGSVHLAQGTAANTTFPNDRGTEILFNREVNHQKHYGVIRGDDNQYQPVPIYIFSGQHTSTSVNQPLILQNLPGGASRGNVGIGLEDPQTSLHVSGSISGSELIGTINGGTF